ncbi:MAG: hypothetical protein ACO1SX_14365 [Actinomycetota bacterium]
MKATHTSGVITLSVLVTLGLTLLVDAAGAAPAATVKFGAEAISCKAALAELSRQTGMTHRAERDLAADKLTLEIHSLSPTAARSAIASALDAEWVSGGTETKSWTLRHSTARRQALASAQARRMQRREAEVRMMSSWLDKEIARGSGRPRGSFSTFCPYAYQVVKEIPRALLEGVVMNPNPPATGTSVDKMPGLSLRASELTPTGRAAFKELLTQLVADVETRRPANAYVRGLPARSNELVLEFWANESAPGSGGGLNMRVQDPTATKPGAEFELTASSHADIERYLDRNNPDKAEPSKTKTAGASPNDRAPVQLPKGALRYDYALARICASAGFNLVADYFTRGKAVKWNGGVRQIGEVLGELEEDFGLRHTWEGSTLVVRTEKWAEALEMEPSAEVVARIAQVSARKGGPRLGDLLFVAARSSDERLTVLGFHMSRTGERLPANLVPRIRANAAWLRTYAALTQDESKRAISPSGVSFSRLSARSRANWESALVRSSLYPSANTGKVVLSVSRDGAAAAFPDWPEVPKVMLKSAGWPSSVNLWQAVDLH